MVTRGNTNGTTANTSSPPDYSVSFTLNVAAGVNKAVVVYLACDSATDPNSVTVGGVSATLIRKNNNGSHYLRTYIAYLGSTTGNVTVVASYSTTILNINLYATDYSNVNQSSGVDNENYEAFTIATSGNDSTSDTASYEGGYVIGVLGWYSLTGGIISPYGGETEFVDIFSGGLFNLQVEGKDSTGAESQTVAWQNTSGTWTAVCASQIIILRQASVQTNDERSAKITGQYIQKQSQSVAIAEPATPITKAVLMPDTTEPSDSSIDWYLSADGGSHWEAVTPNEEHAFTNTGTDLRWRAVHNPSTDGQSFPTIQKVVVSWELGVSTDDERSAKIIGQATTNGERSAKVTGQDTDNDERAGKITGIATANSEREAKITGQTADNSERSARLTGTADFPVDDERSAKVTGTDTDSDERSATMLGLLGSNAERSAKLTGTATTNDTRSAKVTGELTDNEERAGKLTGTDTGNDERSARLAGAIPDERSSKIYAGYSYSVNDSFDTTDNKDAVNTTAVWEGDGVITLG